ncbi:hypothetical protein QOL99_16680 [Deinococcus sp. MIMF12]|uniref:DUF3187 family protein n=1 Tax=Deinococcus rhizophilus TaxID=3049544 RepID=A0ABT7JQ45_9DEIO|nr:hypothetical protein [Deinococcus rhizophilus]MDL2345769.1 hypothetical protein [Deinococcus rhizophilus]
MKSLHSRLAALCLLAAGTAGAQSSLMGFQIPPNYLSRFASTELVISTEAGYGVRALPLLMSQDVRISVVKAPTSWDYNVSTRVQDTTLAAGVFYNVPRLEVTHDPAKGLQYGGLMQGKGNLSKFSAGYAHLLWENRARLLGNVGVAFVDGDGVPYTQTEATAGYGRSFGKLGMYVGGAARLFAFPVQQDAQGSVDAVAVLNVSPLPGLTLDATHFERFVTGEAAVPAFGLGRYNETNAGATYRLPGDAAFGVGAVRTRLSHAWQSDVTTLRGDLLLRLSVLPSLVGPSVGYQWTPDGQGRWLVSLVTLPK